MNVELIEYSNVTRAIATVVSAGKATYRDLGEALSIEDVYDLVEIIAIDAYNQHLIQLSQNADNS